jgi:kynurenine formamidase
VIIDLSVPLNEDTQVFPGDPVPRVTPATTLAEHGFNVLHVDIGSQTGTHVDAPFHVRSDGLRLDELPLDRFFGPAVVANLRGRSPRSLLSWADLEPIWPKLRPGVIVLLNTGWDTRMGSADYFDHPYLAEEAAIELVAAGIRTVGIDAPNLDRTDLDGGPPSLLSHQVLAGAGAVIIENVANMSAIPAGAMVSVLPLRLTGADGAPCRAVAITQPPFIPAKTGHPDVSPDR